MENNEVIENNRVRLISIIGEIADVNQEMQEAGGTESPILLRQALSRLTTLLARVDFLYAETEEILSFARSYYSETLDPKMQATRFKEILEGRVSTEQKVFRQVERTHKTLNTIITTIITQLSFLKEEMKINQMVS